MQYFSHYFWDIDVFLKYLEILQNFFKSDLLLTHLVLEMLTHLKTSKTSSKTLSKSADRADRADHEDQKD